MNIFRKLGIVDYCGLTGLGLILCLAVLLSTLGTAAFAADAVVCAQYGQATGRTTAYRIPAGCFVSFGAHFIPVDEYNARAITHAKATP